MDNINIDMWYGDEVKSIDNLDCYFSDSDCVYCGNFYKNGKAIGDYNTKDSVALQHFIEKHWGKKIADNFFPYPTIKGTGCRMFDGTRWIGCCKRTLELRKIAMKNKNNMTFREYMHQPHPELDRIAEQAEQEREINEDIAWDNWANRTEGESNENH